jgi:superfamily I DNA/RNA helicase
LTILRAHRDKVRLPTAFRVADDAERQIVLTAQMGHSDRRARRLLVEISIAKRAGLAINPNSDLATVIDQYHQHMREQGLVDFDDLIEQSARLLESQVEVAAAYRAKWGWVSVDEFQDIDEGQRRLLRQLVNPEGNLCVIGDPDQSIYGFRGANARSFQQFTKDYPDARTIHLTTNYRSSSTIVDAALQVINPSSLVEARVLESVSDSAERIGIQSCPSERAEAELVVHTVERMIGGTTHFSIDSGRVQAHEGDSLSFNDFAVLYRTEAQADVLEEAFARSGIPMQRRCHRRLSDEPGIQAGAMWIRQALTASGDPGSAMPVVELLKQAADAVWDKHPEAATQLLSLHPVAQRCEKDAAEFLSQLALGVDADLWDPRADRVSLLTLHAAKGLEFPVVFVVGCEDGLLPLRWGKEDEPDLDEERRLFFVGMTRARDRLFLLHAQKRRWRGKVRPMSPSPFLQQIEEELIQRAQHAHRKKNNRPLHTQRELF